MSAPHPQPALLAHRPTPIDSIFHPDFHLSKRQRVPTVKAAEWAATDSSASPILTHFNASKPMAFPATKGNTETISVRQLVSYMPSTAETPSFLRCNACLQPATTLRHIAKTLGKKLREELKGVGTEWEWTPLERGEVVEHLRICEAGPLPPKRKQVVVLPAVDRQREETSERGSVTSDASRTEARRIGRRKLAGAPLVVFKGKRAAVTAAAALKKKESQKKKRSRSRSESTSEKDETPNFEVIIHDDPHLSLVLNHYPPYLPPARIRPSSILRSSNSTSTFTSYLFFIPNLAGRLGVTLQSSVLRVPPTSVGILQGGKGSLVVRDSEVCWTMGRE